MKKYIGDAIMTVPLIDAIETQYSGVHIICGPAVAKVLDHPERERFFLPLDTSRKFGDILRTARELRSHRFDRGVLINHSFRSALTLFLARIPMRVGHVDEGRRFLLTHPVAYDEAKFEAWSELDLAPPLGVPSQYVYPRIPVRASELAEGTRALEGATVGIQPGATFAAKTLPTDLLATVCDRLQAQGHRVALLGAKEELKSSCALLEKLSTPVIDLVGKTDIRTSLGALAGLRLTIGADTGMMHMAVAAGCPTITVFGPTPIAKWGHQYAPHQALQAPDGKLSNVSAQMILESAQKVL
jgi:ADP-heptose:LPS heptosyltransferase